MHLLALYFLYFFLLFVLPSYGFIDSTAEDLDRKQVERDGE